ncbi:hypothetical protein F3Y22_tig00116954pilonHSYRG00144 [Hibiscus syriacus]|uniref:Uncharacterized protein n=1 Tax=Hibiscus syriacus TaxID=106335 RepID=A0A6A2XZI0_HIBSY|nr:hypothetical protein F3Y22_tig00116954pilonHSYRG00144 [Hibiscus syriacus]
MSCFCSAQIPSLAKTLILLPPASRFSSLPLHPIRSNSFSPPLLLSSAPSPRLCRCTSAPSPPPRPDQFLDFLDEEEETAMDTAAVVEEEEEEFYEDDDLDVEALESEAKEAVRRYSTSLSRQLTIEEEIDDLKGFSGKQKRRKTATKTIPDYYFQKLQ